MLKPAVTILLLLIINTLTYAQHVVRVDNFRAGCTCGDAVSFDGSVTIGGVTKPYTKDAEYLLFDLPSYPKGTTPVIGGNGISEDYVGE